MPFQGLWNMCHLLHEMHILECPFIVNSPRHTDAIIMLLNQDLDMSHLPGRWIILANGKCLLTRILTTL